MPGVIVPRSRGGDAVAPVERLPQVDAEVGGARPVAQGLGQLAGQGLDIAIQQKLDDDEARVSEALSLAEVDWQGALFRGDEAILMRKGKNALGGEDEPDVIEAGLTQREEILERHLDGLENDLQRNALRQAWRSRDRFAVSTLQGHQSRERDRYIEETEAATIASSAQVIINSLDNEAMRDAAILDIDAAVDKQGERRGWGEEQMEDAKMRAISPALVQSIELVASSDPAEAERLFKKYSDLELIDARAKSSLMETIQRRGVTKTSQGLADEIMRGDRTMAERLADARAIEDPDVRDATVRRVKDRTNEEIAIRKQEENARVESAWSTVFQGGDVDSIPDDTPATDRRQMETYISQRAAEAAQGRVFKIATKPEVFTELWTLRANDPQAFLARNLRRERLNLSSAHYNQLVQEQDDLGSGAETSKTSPLGLGVISLGNKVLREAGIEETIDRDTFMLQADRAARAAMEEKGAPLTFDEKKAAILGTLEEITVPDAGYFWFDLNKRTGELTLDDRKRIESDPPEDLKQRARAALKETGIVKPDGEQILFWISNFLTMHGVPDDQQAE